MALVALGARSGASWRSGRVGGARRGPGPGAADRHPPASGARASGPGRGGLALRRRRRARAEARAVSTSLWRPASSWHAGELAFWLGTGIPGDPPRWVARPFFITSIGMARSSRAWSERSCPYEQARALAASAGLPRGVGPVRSSRRPAGGRPPAPTSGTTTIGPVPRGPREATQSPSHWDSRRARRRSAPCWPRGSPVYAAIARRARTSSRSSSITACGGARQAGNLVAP